MALRILIIPDKFKGTLTAQTAAESIAAGWRKSQPLDLLELLPMCDGGDGSGEIIGNLIGAKPRRMTTLDAAGRKTPVTWWWEPKTKTAVIESARVIGLAMLPANQYHPFDLDTFGLGKVIRAAEKLGCRKCVIGIGGSATNDGGFGMARALGWKFLDRAGDEITRWTDLYALERLIPAKPLRMKITVAVDVQNPLLGARGATRIYGPQKGLKQTDFAAAEKALRRLATVSRELLKKDFAKVPSAGAAGGLGFGLMAFACAKPESGFDLFARAAHLQRRLEKMDLVITGEGALDQQTLMGKGVGQVALLCKKIGIPCIGLAGVVTEPEKAKKLFAQTHALTDITTLLNAKKDPATYLEALAASVAAE